MSDYATKMLDEHGIESPEYSAAVYEEMLDAEYERQERTAARIENLGAHLEREKREIMRQRRARRRVAEWNARDDAKRAALAESAELSQLQTAIEPPRVLDDNGDWVGAP